MGLMKDLDGLNAVYASMHESGPMMLTKADKMGNTPAWRNRHKKNVKTGQPIYKMADHLKDEYEAELWDVVAENLTELHHLSEEGIKWKVSPLNEKQKDTPDQVKAVIAFDKARKGTKDATYDTEHGDKEQAKKERDYAKWQRDKGAEDAQKSGHPWEHAKGSTREKEGKKSVKHAHIKDSYNSIYREDAQSDAVAQMSGDGGDPQDDAVKQVVKAGKKKRNVKTGRLEIPKESMQHRRNPEGSIKDRFKSRQTDPSKAGFTGIGDSIEDIMKQNAAMKKAAAKKTKKEELELTGKFTEQEIAAILEAERTIASRLERKRKLYDKTTKKAMRDAMETGEASGHNRYRMSSISREYDALKARRDKKEK